MSRHQILLGRRHCIGGELLRQSGPMRRRDVRVSPPRSSFAGFRFPPEVIIVNSRPDWFDAYVTNYAASTVSVINEATNTVTATIPVGRYRSG